MIKVILLSITVFLLSCSNFCIARVETPGAYVIEATKNATRHNNLGLMALEENDYYAAIEEFTIAIRLNPNTHATAIYYNNLGETYRKIGAYSEAQTCYERALMQYNLNFMFYQNLVKCYKARGILKSKINEYKLKGSKNPLSSIILGLCYIENGQYRNGIIILDSFCLSEPDLIITPAVKAYIKDIAKKLYH